MSNLKTPVVNALAFQLVRNYNSQPIPEDIPTTPDLERIATSSGLLDGELQSYLNEAKILATQLQEKEPVNLGTFEVAGNYTTKELQLPDGIELPPGFHLKVENEDSTICISRGQSKHDENSKTFTVRRNAENSDKETIVVNESIFVVLADGEIVPAKIEIKFSGLKPTEETSSADDSGKVKGDHHNCDHNHNHDNSSEDGKSKNAYIPWIAGLAGAVVALLGYITSDQKGKATLAGIGAFGLVGVVTSAIKRASSEGEKVKGWMEGKAAWIIGLGSVLIGGIPYYLSDDKAKGSLLPIGLGVLGGVLAWFLEPARTIFGLPTKNRL